MISITSSSCIDYLRLSMLPSISLVIHISCFFSQTYISLSLSLSSCMPTLPLHRTQKAFIFGFHFGCVFLPMFLSLFNYRLIVFLLEICVNFLPQDAPLWQQMNEHLRVSQGHFHTYLYNFRASKCISQPATFVPSRWPQVP